MQDDLVETAPTEGEGVRAEGGESHRQVLVEVGREVENGVLSGRTVVTHDHLAAKESAEKVDCVLHLGRGDPADAVGVLHPGDAATEAEDEAATGEGLHGAGVARGDHEVAGVVVRRRSGDADALGDSAGGAAQCRRLLLVVALGDERPSEAEFLPSADLVDQIA